MRKLVGLLSVAFAMLGACGGGGGGSSEPTAATPPVQSSAFRALKIGDQWTFDFSGTRDNDETRTGTITMTMVRSITTPFGAVCGILDQASIVNNDVNGQFVRHVRDYYQQDAAGAFRHCGDNGVSNGERFSKNVGGSVLVIPASLTIGQVHSYLETFDNGEWLDCSERIDSYDVIATPDGPVSAFKLTRNCTNSNQTALVDEVWLNPEMFIVKEKVQATGLTYTITLRKFSAGAGSVIDSGPSAGTFPQPSPTPQTGTVVITGPSV